MTTREKETDHARQNARGWLDSIAEMVAGCVPEECGSCEQWHPEGYEGDCRDDDHRFADAGECEEKHEQQIQESPLSVHSVQVRSGWYTPGDSEADRSPEEYEILLSTGGPALRLVGDLSEHGEPESVCMEYQDWGIPWTDYALDRDEEAACLAFAHRFYFGA